MIRRASHLPSAAKPLLPLLRPSLHTMIIQSVNIFVLTSMTTGMKNSMRRSINAMFIIRFISESKKDMLRRKVSFPGAITVGGIGLGKYTYLHLFSKSC